MKNVIDIYIFRDREREGKVGERQKEIEHYLKVAS